MKKVHNPSKEVRKMQNVQKCSPYNIYKPFYVVRMLMFKIKTKNSFNNYMSLLLKVLNSIFFFAFLVCVASSKKLLFVGSFQNRKHGKITAKFHYWNFYSLATSVQLSLVNKRIHGINAFIKRKVKIITKEVVLFTTE